MAKPRLLFLTDKFAPHAGGTAVIYGQWCDRLPAADVNVCTTWFPGWREFDASREYRIDRVPYINIPKLRMPLVWAGIRRQAFRLARSLDPDVVHAGQILETGLTALAIKRRFGVPYIVHTYGEEINFYSRYTLTRRWMRQVLAGASAVTSVSTYTADRMKALGLWQGPVALQHPGTDTSRFTGLGGEAVRARYGIGSAPLLVTVGRLMPRKGHDRVLEALPAIREAVPQVRYLIVGQGMHEGALREQVARQRLEECVIFAGRQVGDDLPPYFAAADVFVHPNRELANGDVEGFGMVFLEAGASGLPVIGGNSGGTPDAIRHGETGYLVDPNDVGEIAQRTLALLGDPDLCRRMGQRGREWAAGFTWEQAAEKVLELSRAAVGERR